MKKFEEAFGHFRLSLYTEQIKVVREISDFLINSRGRKMKRLKARAGTGKTHTVGSFVEKINKVSPHGKQIAVCAFTGRAAGQLSSHGLEAKTIHSILYSPMLDDDGNLVRWQKNDTRDIRSDYFAIIVDEGSMVNSQILDDLVDVGIPILIMGDFAQVPSISDDSFNIMSDDESMVGKYLTHPDSVLLTNRRTDPLFAGIYKIMDSILDDGVIPRFCREAGVSFVNMRDFNSPNYFDENKYDIVLCGTNSLRRKINNKIRKSNNYNDLRPEAGERIICLKNTFISNKRINNGDLFTVEGRLDSDDRAVYFLKELKISVTILDESLRTEKAPQNAEDNGVAHFTYGYCISVHKAQGSTFDNVLFVDEDVSYFVNRRNFRYTAVSRAAKHLTIAR